MVTDQGLRPHQIEAVDAVLRHLQLPAGVAVPEEGLRCQVIAATASGKTRIAAVAAQRLCARRVLVLVPTVDLLAQMAAEWRRAGRAGAMVGACESRVAASSGMPCTTNAAELLSWVGDEDVVTVFSTYATASTAVQGAHRLGLDAFDLMVVDEAHRTSGDAAKAWAAVHDQVKMPAVRRLYMTATARIWESAEDARRGGREAPRLIASMDPESPVFGPVAWKLTLSQAISRGLVAPYQVICVDISDPDLYAAQAGGDRGSDLVRGARLAALQAGLLTAAADENLRKCLTFHSRIAEAEAMAEGLPAVAKRLYAEDPKRYHPAERVGASWLHGDHRAGYRKAMLEEFASNVVKVPDGKGGTVSCAAMFKMIASVRVLGEGVDTKNCDSVAFCDARGSMVDIVQMVGRALRMQPGEGKIASLVVPVFLAPGESPDEMMTSRGYETLAKVLGALRAHDTDVIEALADSRPRTGRWKPDGAEGVDGAEGRERTGEAKGPSAPAQGLLRFSTPRDPAEVARFVALRVLHPETDYWRSGIAAAARYVREVAKDGVLKVAYDYVTPVDEGWESAGFPLGTWLRNQRMDYRAGTLAPERVKALEELGVVWSHRDHAFEEGLAAARRWASEHGHFLPPAHAVWDGYPVGTWAKNLRTAARLADARAEQLEAGLPDGAFAGGLSQERREALDEIDPGWSPVWDAGWQRCLRLVQNHLAQGGSVPWEAGEVVVQGEDLGRWVKGCRLGWEALQPAQQWLLENALGLGPAGEDERPVQRTQDDKWMLNLAAARQFHAREGHLRVPRKHEEQLVSDGGGFGAQVGAGGVVVVKLGTWIDNVRKRAGKLPEQRRAELDQLGMQWAAGTAGRSR
ncbi:DEAD/DEAH box helicase [Streptomyces sp. Wh19]|uniref:DEAD/DEAH box helicase n=1 Tax=Streptomyces sp. Wh19 TaxID=3076629 RepID=UPI0029583D01|nr:Helicase associated domain protein [Streptomyces sp. Wh19]MDV9195878.1 Helicase associated domain protein [Streptomyces sp. Wh19]